MKIVFLRQNEKYFVLKYLKGQLRNCGISHATNRKLKMENTISQSMAAVQKEIKVSLSS
jgi:hypothetical protein